MEGSPVRGQERAAIVRLNESPDLQTFQAELVRLLASELAPAEALFGLMDLTANALQLPPWVRSHLERHPGLYRKLEQGEMVGISHTEENPVLRPVAASRSSVVLVPMIHDAVLQATIAIVSPLEGRQLSAE